MRKYFICYLTDSNNNDIIGFSICSNKYDLKSFIVKDSTYNTINNDNIVEVTSLYEAMNKIYDFIDKNSEYDIVILNHKCELLLLGDLLYNVNPEISKDEKYINTILNSNTIIELFISKMYNLFNIKLNKHYITIDDLCTFLNYNNECNNAIKVYDIYNKISSDINSDLSYYKIMSLVNYTKCKERYIKNRDIILKAKKSGVTSTDDYLKLFKVSKNKQEKKIILSESRIIDINDCSDKKSMVISLYLCVDSISTCFTYDDFTKLDVVPSFFIKLKVNKKNKIK